MAYLQKVYLHKLIQKLNVLLQTVFLMSGNIYLNIKEFFKSGNQKKFRKFKIFLLLLFFVFLSGRLLQLVDKYSVNIFFWDQWDFYTPLFENRSLWEIFSYLHFPHRQGIAMVVDKYVFELSNWDTRIETFFIVFVVILTSILALYLKYKLYKKISFSDIFIPLLFLNAGAYESYLQVPNPSHSAFPLLIVLLYCLTLTFKNIHAKYIFLLLANFLGIYTGFSIFLGLLTPVLILFGIVENRKNGKTFFFLILIFFISIISFLSFFINYKFGSASSCFVFPHTKPFEYVEYISLQYIGIIRPTGAINSGVYLGFIFAAFTVISAFLFSIRIFSDAYKSIPAKKNLLVIISLLLFSLLFSLNNAIGRVCFSVDYGQNSRYYIYLVPGFLGIYFAIFEISKKNKKFGLFFSVVVVILFGYSNFKFKSRIDFQIFKAVYFKGKKEWKECYVKYQDIEVCDKKTGFKIYPYAKGTSLREKLDFLKENKYNLFKNGF